MSGKYTIKQFNEFRDTFLKVNEPKDLAYLLKITVNKLASLTKKDGYIKNVIYNGKRKRRVVTEPFGDLKAAQQLLNRYLQVCYFAIKPDCVHGFVKSPSNQKTKYTILSNAKPHCGKEFVVSADIFRFFPSITGKMVRDVFLNEPFNFDINLASAVALLCINKNWLPTGAPTSPVIANLVCFNLDADLEQLAKKYNYTFTRYADDMTFSGELRPDDKFKDHLKEILEKHRFQLNYKKCRVQSKHTRQMVTGIVVNEKPNVKREYIRTLRAIKHNAKVNGSKQATGQYFNTDFIGWRDEERFMNSLNAKLGFVKLTKTFTKNSLWTDFIETWGKEFEHVCDILKYSSHLSEMRETVEFEAERSKSSLIAAQKEWLWLQSRFTHRIEKHFFKPYWIPIDENSLTLFIDLSNKNYPVFETEFVCSENSKWSKKILLAILLMF